MEKYPLIIEKDSNYAFVIKESKKLTFDLIRKYSTEFYRMLPNEIQERLYDEILHGACELDSEPKLNAYMYALGKMHNAKLYKAYSNLSDEFINEKTIDIIDYGCGQGMGCISYSDFLRENNLQQKVRRIILIEPSKKALERAALNVSAMYPKTELITINKGFDDLCSEDLFPDKDIPTLHIISNVLDMATTCDSDGFFDLEDFANLISTTIDGKNEFVCVEPLFGYEPKDEKVDAFINKAGINTYYTLTKGKGEFVNGKDWTCVIRVGKVYKNVRKNTNKCSFEELLKKAEQGDASAQFELGLRYKKGQGVIQSYTNAVKWYRMSAEQGNAKAQFNLACCYANEEGVEQDYKKTVFWCRRSAEQGYARAQFNLGYCYDEGQGVEQDYKKAVYWYRKSAEQGNARAQFYLGYCYDEGQGVEQDYENAVYWYRKSAEQGNASAQNNLGLCYENGDGVEQDYEKAVFWYRKSAEQGNIDARNNLEEIDNKIEQQTSWHEYVDLGLPSGLKWATCNVGANSPEEYGDYYAWGEIKSKKNYNKYNCINVDNLVGLPEPDDIIEIDISGNEQYDVVRYRWGMPWKLPNDGDFLELLAECEFKWKMQKGKKGCEVIGPNGNSIFLPACGCYDGTTHDMSSVLGYYWSSVLGENNDYELGGCYEDYTRAVCLCIGKEESSRDVECCDRYLGFCIRPVSE